MFSEDSSDEHLFINKGSSSPEDVLLSGEKMELIMEAMETLPENQRVAFTLGRIDGFSQKEIAEILGTTESAVESLNARARKKLRHQITVLFEKKYNRQQEK